MAVACEVCHEELEPDRLRTGVLARVCLECLSEEERRALQHDLDLAAETQARLLPARNFTFGPWQMHYHYPFITIGHNYWKPAAVPLKTNGKN